MPPKTLQVAVLGGNEDAVLVGLRNFPAHKLAILSTNDNIARANELATTLKDTLKLTVDVISLKDPSISAVLEAICQLTYRDSEGFQDFLINVGSASRNLTSAAVAAAFVYGVKAFDVAGEQPILLPIMKFSYAQAITGAKMEILRAIERAGGDVESLEKLSSLSDFGKPLLSYHIRGSEESRGLEYLGLVEVERGKRGRLRVKLTPLGKTVLSSATKG